MALLNNDPHATFHYAPLLYHLAGCEECHRSYLDLYDSMRAAVQPREPRPLLGQGTRTLGATPTRMLGHLSQVLISQAEVVLRQARHDHTDADVLARSLLQLALRISTHITQSVLRREALQDLVRVATLFDASVPPLEQDPDVHTYTATLIGAGGMRGKKVVRRADISVHSLDQSQEMPVIQLQSRSLNGSIIQQEHMLELHLQGLDASLRGHYVTVSVPLGSLIEPVRWLGGNPRTIRSIVPVDSTGLLVMPLGETELSLVNAEEYHLLEAMFLLLEVRVAD
jgi:hypothetical protein